MCVGKPRHPVPRQDRVMAAWRVQEAVGVVVSPTARAHPHRESCLFVDDVVDTTHLAWLVVAPIVGFCEHVRGRCGVFSVQESCFFRSMCSRDRSAETRRGFAMAAIGLFHVEVVMS